MFCFSSIFSLFTLSKPSSQWDQGNRGLTLTEPLGTVKHFSYYLTEYTAALSSFLFPFHSEEPKAQRVNRMT